jgi:hypothetical protein
MTWSKVTVLPRRESLCPLWLCGWTLDSGKLSPDWLGEFDRDINASLAPTEGTKHEFDTRRVARSVPGNENDP